MAKDKKYTHYEVKVFLFLFNKSGEYLYLKNDNKESITKGYVNPPTGHIEIGETVYSTMRREIKEETGIDDVEDINLRGIVNVEGFKVQPMFVFVITGCVPDNQKIKEGMEGKPIWIHPKNIEKYKTFEDVRIITKLLRETPKTTLFHAVSKFEDGELISFYKENPDGKYQELLK